MAQTKLNRLVEFLIEWRYIENIRDGNRCYEIGQEILDLLEKQTKCGCPRGEYCDKCVMYVHPKAKDGWESVKETIRENIPKERLNNCTYYNEDCPICPKDTKPSEEKCECVYETSSMWHKNLKTAICQRCLKAKPSVQECDHKYSTATMPPTKSYPFGYELDRCDLCGDMRSKPKEKSNKCDLCGSTERDHTSTNCQLYRLPKSNKAQDLPKIENLEMVYLPDGDSVYPSSGSYFNRINELVDGYTKIITYLDNLNSR